MSASDLLPKLRAERCPCPSPNCRSGNIAPITYHQGVMRLDDAREIAHRCNLFAELLAALKDVKKFSVTTHDLLSLGQLIEKAEKRAPATGLIDVTTLRSNGLTRAP